MRLLSTTDLGRTEYTATWELQAQLLELRVGGHIGDTLLLTEHDPVYTIGKTGTDDHLLAADDELQARGVSVVHNDRGGDITFHGPGQLVGYPILDLSLYGRDLHRYLRDLEEVVIRTLSRFGVDAGRSPGYTGVWVGDEKICAIGVKTSRWVTMHGFALNVNTDLSFFDRIIPCGIFEKGVTSMQNQLTSAIEIEHVARTLVAEFSSVFNVHIVSVPGDQLLSRCAGTRSMQIFSISGGQPT